MSKPKQGVQMKHEYVTESKQRAHRMHNIAVAVIELAKQHPGFAQVPAADLRHHIRKQLKMPTLDPKAKQYDLAATGDAVGRHGLKLERIRKFNPAFGRMETLVVFNETNLRICAEYLSAAKTETLRLEVK
jgi:hypothetical protein